MQEALRWTKPSSEVDVLFIDDEPADIQLPSGVDLEVTQADPGLRGDSVSGGGTKPATLETGATHSGAAVRRGGRAHPRGHALRRIRLARVGLDVRRSDQRRAAVVALYQHDLTGRPLVETLGPNASLFARALAYAAADRAEELDAGDRPPRARLVGAADPAAGAQHHARGADRDAASRCGPGGAADPGGGGDRGGGGEREDVLRRRGARRS